MGRAARRAGWRLLVPVALVVAGLLFATSAGTARGTDLRAEETADLASVLRDEQRRVEEQGLRVQALREEVERLSAAAARSDSGAAAARERAERVAERAALTPVTGEALTVVLDDAPYDDPEQVPEGVVPDDLVVHQQDLQGVVNALWAGGAEAMRLMDQRVVSTSAVRCVGNVLILQGRTYSPPYRVTAVGDVAGMRAALEAAPSVQAYRYWAERVGLGYEVAAEGTTTLAGYEGSLDLQHARVPEDAAVLGD
ncbi:DUF881 domain-containing protein [Vallicoccus soli]|uniref:DUF881 domain-containing protein n=1 Tax=Vallicoccus soli TaxID=2339232 RepID=A0A3A3ZHD6_9ACTN|nr:DUF881 domain-containing protein [Vallicoccus soli]RJK94720.1 DUF881 domain-containing protein [Vallicoccus soli]